LVGREFVKHGLELLTFDHGAANWCWDLNRIYAKDYTENVVDLMVGKFNRLPVDTQTEAALLHGQQR